MKNIIPLLLFLLIICSNSYSQDLISSNLFITKTLGSVSSQQSYHIGNAYKDSSGKLLGTIIFEVIQARNNGGNYAKYKLSGSNGNIDLTLLEKHDFGTSYQVASITIDEAQSGVVPVYLNTLGGRLFHVIIKSGPTLTNLTPSSQNHFQYFNNPSTLTTPISVLDEDPYYNESFWSEDSGIISHSGTVGIGTTSTGSHKLAIEGSVGAREVHVEATGWSDFVFKDNYNLISLEELEKFIERNGHLPDIPNETEVMENGIDLGQMNAKLLQKIEELTLYIIDQNKELKAQKGEIDILKDELEELKKLPKSGSD